MELSKLQKVLLIGIILLIFIIPTTAYVISFRFKAQTSAKANLDKVQDSKIKPLELPKSSPVSSLIKTSESTKSATSDTPVTNEIAQISFGPTLSFRVVLEGRPTSNQATKLFLGIAEGAPTTNPTYLLSFNVDIPSTGAYSNLSLAGLNVGSTYSAYLKGPAQIASASAFIVKPTVTDLGAKKLITGDINEDNAINSTDYSVVRSVLGVTPASPNWNANFDFNLDGIINNIDLGIITKNMGTTGQSGVWTSPNPSSSPKSGRPLTPVNMGSAESSSSGEAPSIIPGTNGYWIWVPK